MIKHEGKKMKAGYLILPYSHPEKMVREIRAIQADRAAASLIERGYNIFSPISHSHRIANFIDNHNDSDFWCEIDEYWQRQCEIVFLLQLNGWDESNGVRRELILALELCQPVFWVDPIYLDISEMSLINLKVFSQCNTSNS